MYYLLIAYAACVLLCTLFNVSIKRYYGQRNVPMTFKVMSIAVPYFLLPTLIFHFRTAIYKGVIGRTWEKDVIRR